MQIGRYAHAKQFRRMKRSLRTLKSRVGRVYRDIGRQIDRIAESRQDAAKDLMHRVNRILAQTTKDKNKLYALHAPEVECISKGKARTPYEFGVKVTVATTLKEGFVVGDRGGLHGTRQAQVPRAVGEPQEPAGRGRTQAVRCAVRR